MSTAPARPEPSPYPIDPASFRWDVALAIVGVLWFAALVMLGSEPILLLVHVATAAALFVYARPRTGRVVAFAMGIVFLSLAAADVGAIASSHLGLSVSTAAGAWALLILLGAPPIRYAWVAAALLLAAVVASGVGAAFLVATVTALLPRPRRVYLWTVVPALLAAAIWLATLGTDVVMGTGGLTEVPGSVVDGTARVVGQISGLGPQIGLLLIILLGLATLHTLRSSHSKRLGLIAGTVGLLMLYTIISFAPLAIEAEATSSLVLPAAVFVSIACSSWLAHRPLDVPGHRLRLILVVSLLVAVVILGNLGIGLSVDGPVG